MCEGYDPPLEDDHPHLEDELLCEYVDGTMDPVVRKVFDEYLLANPDLQDHVECLRDMRTLLCRYGCRCHAPRDLHDRLRRQITCDLVQAHVPFHVLLADRLKGATMTSAVAVILVLGVVGGFSIMQDSEYGASVVSAAVVSPTVPQTDIRHSEIRQMAPAYRFTPRAASAAPLRASISFVSQQPNASRAVLTVNPKLDTSVTLLSARVRQLP